MSQISARVGSVCPFSPSEYYKDYTCSVCGSSCVVFQGRCGAKLKKKKKKPSAGHHFHWQLLNKLKQRDAGTIFLPLLFSLPTSFSAPLLLQTAVSFPPESSTKWWAFQVLEWWKGYITPSIQFSSDSQTIFVHRSQRVDGVYRVFSESLAAPLLL